MRVLFISPAVLAGKFDALADQTIFMARAAAVAGHDVAILTDGKNSQNDSEQPIHIFATGGGWGPAAIVPFIRVIRTFRRHDVIVMHYTSFNYGPLTVSPILFVVWCKLKGVPFRVFAHEFFYRRPHAAIRSAWRERWFSLRDQCVLGLADVIIVSGLEARKRLARELPRSLKKTLPVGIFANVGRPAAPWRPHARTEKIWLSFGAVTMRRRLEILVDGLVDALDRGTLAQLRVVGRINDEGYVERVKQYAQSRGVEDRVAFTGMLSRERVGEELLEADLVLHAAAEGLTANSSTLSAAFVYGVPVVAVETEKDEPALVECALTIPATELGSVLNAISCSTVNLDGVVAAARKRADDVLDISRITEAVLIGRPS